MLYVKDTRCYEIAWHRDFDEMARQRASLACESSHDAGDFCVIEMHEPLGKDLGNDPLRTSEVVDERQVRNRRPQHRPKTRVLLGELIDEFADVVLQCCTGDSSEPDDLERIIVDGIRKNPGQIVPVDTRAATEQFKR